MKCHGSDGEAIWKYQDKANTRASLNEIRLLGFLNSHFPVCGRFGFVSEEEENIDQDHCTATDTDCRPVTDIPEEQSQGRTGGASYKGGGHEDSIKAVPGFGKN